MLARYALLLIGLFAAAPSQALYDPAPDVALAAIEGDWTGTLTYRDYSPPHGLVTLPTRLFVALQSGDELALHYVYDDGPGKTVHSYESLRFQFAEKQVTWSSGVKRETTVGRIVTDTTDASIRRVVVETTDADGRSRHTFEFAPDRLRMSKDEINANGASTMRDAYEFRRR